MTEKILRFRWLIIAVMVLAFVPKTVQAEITLEKPLLGEGSKDDPYQIKTKENLYWFANEVNNNGKTNICAVLTADITVNNNVLDADGNLNNENTDFYEWTPIGYFNHYYIGTFDGKGHTISGLYYNGKKEYVGLFGLLDVGGNIRNVGVKASYFNGDTNSCVGGVCGRNEGGKISNCCNERTTVSTTKNPDASVYVGGVCGYNSSGGTIENCYNVGNVSGGYRACIGGVCGYNSGDKIENCYNAGNVSGESNSDFIGGVCGINISYGRIKNCYNTGKVNGGAGSSNKIGGVCGQNLNGTIENCYFLGGTANSGIGEDLNYSYSAPEMFDIGVFESGKVAWLLNNYYTQDNTSPWLQNIGVDASPVLKAKDDKCIAVIKEGTTYTNPDDHAYINNTFADFPDTGTANLYSQVCDHCKGAAKEDKKKIKELNCKDNDITITKEDNVWKTEAKITVGDDPTTNWYNAPVEFTTTGEVSYTRTMSDKNRWATICLPYAVSTENENCKFYELSGVVPSEKITLTEITDETIEAGTPVFVKRNDNTVNSIDFTASNVKMIQTPKEQTADKGKLVGTFNTMTLTMDDNSDCLFIKNDNMWSVGATRSMTVKPFRAYIVPDTSISATKLSIAVDGEATAISDALDTLNDTNAEYYDMSGRRINALQKGVNIIKSGNKTRKVIIK